MISREMISRAFPSRPLGEIVEFLDGLRRPVTESERHAGPYPYYGANGQQGTINDFIFDEPLLLLAEDGGHFETPQRGIAYLISGKTWVNNHAHVLRPRQGVDLGFLCRVLENYDVTPWVTGTTRGKLTQGGASQIVVPIPPLAEQQRIAGILDKADALRVKRRAALAQVDALTQSIFLDMFGDPVRNPRGWPLRALGNLLSRKPNNGIFRKGEEYSQTPDCGLPVVWVEELFRGDEINTAMSRRLNVDRYDIASYGLKHGDLLFCRSSLKLEGIAQSNVYLGANDGALFECHLIRVSPDATVLDPVFLNSLMRLPMLRAIARSKAKTATMTTIDQDSLCSINVIVPPIELQSRFARRLVSVKQLRNSHKASTVALNDFFSSLQYRAFRGNL